MYHRTNQFIEALKCFSRVELKIKDDKTVYLARGAVFQDMGNHQLAITDFEKAIDISSSYPESYFRMARSKFALKQYDDAIKDFEMSEKKEGDLK